jgi:hypothetical protein
VVQWKELRPSSIVYFLFLVDEKEAAKLRWAGGRGVGVKGTVRPDWICMRVVPLDRPMRRTSTAIGFRFFNFDLEYLKRVQSSEPLNTKKHLILLLVL